ncbi:MAG: CRTAC1 family protein, partial [Kofleriaceae bacterium]|nr:CRTAC1 family protein [Kofleriaceae bacterium]
DLYVANDFGANAMYRNLGNGRFESVAEKLHTADRGSGMNVAVSDVNGDGKWDLYVTNIDMFSKNIKVVFPTDDSTIDISESLTKSFQYLSGNQFYVSTAEGGFSSEESQRFEPRNRGWGWDAAFFDVDNDGDKDLYLTNGWVQGSYAGGQKNQLYLNGDGYFYAGPEDQDYAFAGNSRSAALLDFDNDGDLDIVVNNFRQPPRLLENVQHSGNRWLRIALKGKGNNPYAIGAKVEIRFDGKTVLRQVAGGRGYLSQDSSTLSIGLGKAKLADLKVFWPDGSTSEHKGLRSDALHRIEQ